MLNPTRTTTLLELHVPDFEKTKQYYGQLGFEVVWERQPEELKGYLVMRMDDNILCFWPGNEYIFEQPYFKRFPNNTKRGYGVEIVIMVADVEAYYEQVKDFANVVEELILQPWGLKDFRVEDPFGYYLRFTTPHDIVDVSNAVD
jgi:hypothetical protein